MSAEGAEGDAAIVVVGAGQAALQLAASLREAGCAAPITLVGDEAGLPYQRPPLSKAYLAGKAGTETLWLRSEAFLEQHRISLLAGTRAVAIDRTARRVRLDDGGVLAYAHLVLATGSRNRPPPFPGGELTGVHQLRSLADADALGEALAGAGAVAVIGGGFIGLEFAAVCAARGLPVTVVEAAGTVMARAVSGETARWFAARHGGAGVAIRCAAVVEAIEGRDGRACAIRVAGGDRIPADLVLVGIGVLANDGLAQEAGLAVRDGIEVDALLATADPAISAIGDCARFPTRFAAGLVSGEGVRIESVQNAIDQARCLADRLNGRARAYAAVPWFWSDQGRDKLQIAGLAGTDDPGIARLDETGGTVLRFRDGVLAAVETVNRPGDHMAARRLLAAETRTTFEQASAEGFDLRSAAKRAS